YGGSRQFQTSRRRREAKLREELLHARTRARKAAVVARLRDPSDGETRLVRIQLPRMQIKRGRNAAVRVLTETMTNDTERQVTEIGSPGGRDARATPCRGG